jgi:hypothetical protein
MASKVGMNFAIQIKGKKRKKEKILSLSHTCIPTWPGGYLVQRESSLSSSSFYQIKYKKKQKKLDSRVTRKANEFLFRFFFIFFWVANEIPHFPFGTGELISLPLLISFS